MIDLVNIGIDYSSYFNQTGEYRPPITTNSEYSPDDLGEAINIKMRICGENKFYTNEDTQITVAEKSYKTMHPVMTKGEFNGQRVVAVKPIYEFDGSLAYYKFYV